VLLSNVPRLTETHFSEIRRLTWLVDILYDRGVKLIVSAQAAPLDLVADPALQREFERTASRLIEMQSREYSVASRRRPDQPGQRGQDG